MARYDEGRTLFELEVNHGESMTQFFPRHGGLLEVYSHHVLSHFGMLLRIGKALTRVRLQDNSAGCWAHDLSFISLSFPLYHSLLSQLPRTLVLGPQFCLFFLGEHGSQVRTTTHIHIC